MIGWGDILSAEQIQQLVAVIRQFKSCEPEPQPTQSQPSFSADVLPVFEQKCVACHGNLGGWGGSNYEDVMTSGDHAPVIIPGDIENSLLAQKLLGTQSVGTVMPPAGKLPDAEIQAILDWIAAGAPEN
jgi:cytochrome c5